MPNKAMIRIKRPFLLTALTLLFTELVLMAGYSIIPKILLVILPVIFIVTCIRKMAISKAVLLITAAVAVASLSFSCNTAVYENEAVLAGYNKTVTGTVSEISYDENGIIHSALLTDCTVDNTEISSDIRIYTNETAAFTYGDRISLTPFRLAENEGEGLFRYHTLSDKTGFNAYSAKDTDYTVTAEAQGTYAAIAELRQWVRERLSSAFSGDIKGISEALITGSTDSLSDRFTLNLRKCGISHIFAVSGMHLSIWTGLFFLILKNKAKTSVLPNLLASVFVLFYIVFTGFSPSVMRAGIMLLFVFFGRMLKKASDTLNTLGIAGTILLCANPFLAGNVSFLLSFTATAAIILWNDYLLEAVTYPKGRLRFIKDGLRRQMGNILTSAGVILTTLPLTSVFFGYVSLVSPVVSLGATPLATGIMISSFIQLIIPEDLGIYSLAKGITELQCKLLTSLTDFFSEMDFMIIGVKPQSVLPIFIITSVICAAVVIFLKNKRLSLICVLAGALVFTGTVAADTYIHKDEATVFIAGEENSTLISIVAPSGSHTAVYGAGGSYSQLYKLKNYLSSRGILSADLLFVPRLSTTENGSARQAEKMLLPDNKIYAPTGCYHSTIYEGTDIYNVTSDDFAASVITVNGVKIVICTLPSSDFSDCDEIFTSGDILVCRSAVPKAVDPNSFSDIIIMTDKDRAYDFSYISTKDSNTEITIKGASYAIN